MAKSRGSKRAKHQRRGKGKKPRSSQRGKGSPFSQKEHQALARKASLGIKERMAAGMTEDEAIRHLVNEDPSLKRAAEEFKASYAEDLEHLELRKHIRNWIMKGRPLDEVEEMAWELMLKEGVPRQGRQRVREKLRRVITREVARLEDPEEFVLDAKRVALLQGASPEEAEAEADKLRAQIEHVRQLQQEADQNNESLRKKLATLEPGDLQELLRKSVEMDEVSYNQFKLLVAETLSERRRGLEDLLRDTPVQFSFTHPSQGPGAKVLPSTHPFVQEALNKALGRLDVMEQAILVDTVLGHALKAKDAGEPPMIDLDLEIDRIKARRGPTRSWLISGSPELYEAQKRDKPQDQTVEAYMEAVANAFQVTRLLKSPKDKQDAIYLWQCLREARVFHFDAEVYIGLHSEIDRYTTEDLAGLEYQPPGTKKKIPAEETDHLLRTILREGKRTPYPEKFPFPCIFIGYGNGVEVPAESLTTKAPRDLRDRLKRGVVIGHIIVDDGYTVAVIKALVWEKEGSLSTVVWFDHLRDQHGGWVRSEFNLEPWILPGLIKIINDHRTFIVETPLATGMRQHYKQKRKDLGLKPKQRGYTPPPYYTLRMKSKLIREKVRRGLPKPVTPRSYRTDVRGHERCRVMRGTIPLDPEVGAKLNRRGYKIFTVNDLDADTLRRLHERGLPYKRSDEWLAILTCWVSEHYTSNDDNLPYIPACRVPGDVRTKVKQPSRGWTDDPASV